MLKLTSVIRALQFGTAIVILVFTQTFVLAANSQISKNEATLSRFKTCGAANKAGYKNLRTRVGFTPKGAKRSFDADKDGISCEAR